MSLSIQDGFNFSMGQWIAELTRAGIGLAVLVGVVAIGYGLFILYDRIRYRRVRK